MPIVNKRTKASCSTMPCMWVCQSAHACSAICDMPAVANRRVIASWPAKVPHTFHTYPITICRVCRQEYTLRLAPAEDAQRRFIGSFPLVRRMQSSNGGTIGASAHGGIGVQDAKQMTPGPCALAGNPC